MFGFVKAFKDNHLTHVKIKVVTNLLNYFENNVQFLKRLQLAILLILIHQKFNL
jgi:hypothetical protein